VRAACAREQEVAPEAADHRAERARREAVARGVLGGDALPAAVLERDARAAGVGLEADLDLRHLSGREVPVAPVEDEPRARLPDAHAPELEHVVAELVVDLEQPAAHAGLSASRSALEPAGGARAAAASISAVKMSNAAPGSTTRTWSR
jgi:hypothetical protein